MYNLVSVYEIQLFKMHKYIHVIYTLIYLTAKL